MRFKPAAAKDARRFIPVSRTRYVDIAHDTAANPASLLPRRNPANLRDFAHKFVPRRAAKIMIAAQNPNVGIADSGESHPHQRPPRTHLRHRSFLPNELLIVDGEGQHGLSYRALEGFFFCVARAGNALCRLPEMYSISSNFASILRSRRSNSR